MVHEKVCHRERNRFLLSFLPVSYDRYKGAIQPVRSVINTRRSSSQFLLHYLRPHLTSILLATAASFLLAITTAIVVSLIGPGLQLFLGEAESGQTLHLASLTGPYLARLLIALGSVSELSRQNLLAVLPISLILVSGLRTLFSTLQFFLWERLSEKAACCIRQDIVEGFLRLDPQFHHADSQTNETNKHVNIDERLSSLMCVDIRYLREYMVHFFGSLPRELAKVATLSATLILLSPKHFLIFGMMTPLAIVGIRRLGKKLLKRSSHALDHYATVTEWIQARLLGLETIKHYRSEARETKAFARFNQEMQGRFVRAARIKARTGPVLELLGVAAMVFALTLALVDIQQGHLASSVAISFFASLAMLAQSGAAVGRYLNSNREGSAALTRILDFEQFLLSRKRQDIGRTCVNQQQAIKVKDLSLRYTHEASGPIENFSYQFERGKIYGIIGPSGCGKSTLISGILGLVAPHHGKILFHEDVGRQGIGYVPQSPKLMSDSLLANTIYPDLVGDEKRVKDILESLGMKKLLDELSEGIHTRVGPRGRTLSGGQAQRIFLARILYHKYPIVIIDEGTSALDRELEAIVLAQINELRRKQTTVLFVSHRPKPIEIADKTLGLAPAC